MERKEENEIKSLILDEGIVEEAKRISLRFKELVTTALILALGVNLLSDILWSISEMTTPDLSFGIKVILAIAILGMLIFLYDDLARIHTRTIREIFKVFNEPIYIDPIHGTIPDIPFFDSRSSPLHFEAEMHFDHLDDAAKEQVVSEMRRLDEKNRWAAQHIGCQLFAVLMLLYNLGRIRRVPYYPLAQIRVTEIISEESPFMDEKDREYFGLQAPGSPYYSLELD
ncbi:MAG: hypothetical protein ACFFER_17900, partial [Candidatus Thorarchaeota archaeon]